MPDKTDSRTLPPRTRIWLLQILWDALLRALELFGIDATSYSFRDLVAAIASVLGFFMVFYPITVFVNNLRSGILLAEPALALTFLGGIVGIGLGREGLKGSR
jgi:hypothetical protein